MAVEEEKKSFKERNGYSRVGGIFRFIGKKAPHLLGKGLDVLGGQVGLGDIGTAIGLVEKDKEIDPKDKEFILDELKLALREKELEIQAENNRLKDVQNARQHEIEQMKSADGFVRKFKPILAITIILATLVLFAIIVFFEIPEKNKDLLNISFGGLLTQSITIVGYYFGTSQSSTDKNKIIGKK